jgi:hypothetical protein
MKWLFVVSICLAAVGCTCGKSKIQSNACVPKSCRDQGKECGTLDDGCGGTFECGTCIAPLTCGARGIPNECDCVATTCAAVGKNCGVIADGCRGTLNCGSCSGDDTCGNGEFANVCVKPMVCVPKTCAQLAVECGTAQDGCGTTLDCGGCACPATCGGTGMAGVCGAPAAACPTTSSWMPIGSPDFDTPWAAVAVSACNMYVAGSGGKMLHWDGASWNPQDTGFGAQLTELAVAADGTAFVVGHSRTFGRNTGSGWTEIKTGAPYGEYMGITAVSANKAWAVGYSGDNWELVVKWDGTTWTQLPSPQTPDGGVLSPARHVWASGDNDVWVVTDTTLFHYDGSSWTPFKPGPTNPVTYYTAAFGTGPTDVWFGGSAPGLLWHWDGTMFTEQSVALMGWVQHIRGTGPNNVWAVDADGRVIQWCGSSWSSQGGSLAPARVFDVLPVLGYNWLMGWKAGGSKGELYRRQ